MPEREGPAVEEKNATGCGGPLRLLATITDERVIRRILRHLGLPAEVPEPAPARQSGWWLEVQASRISSA